MHDVARERSGESVVGFARAALSRRFRTGKALAVGRLQDSGGFRPPPRQAVNASTGFQLRRVGFASRRRGRSVPNRGGKRKPRFHGTRLESRPGGPTRGWHRSDRGRKSSSGLLSLEGRMGATRPLERAAGGRRMPCTFSLATRSKTGAGNARTPVSITLPCLLWVQSLCPVPSATGTPCRPRRFFASPRHSRTGLCRHHGPQ